jgi:hypothetical protein
MVPINKYVAAIAVGLAMSARQEAARDCSAKAGECRNLTRTRSRYIAPAWPNTASRNSTRSGFKTAGPRFEASLASAFGAGKC